MAPVEATYADGTPVHEASGLRTDNNFAVNFADRIGEKKERRMSDLARKEGRAPLHFHKSGSRRPQKKEA